MKTARSALLKVAERGAISRSRKMARSTGKSELPLGQLLVQDLGVAGLVPQALKQQRCSDSSSADFGQSLSMLVEYGNAIAQAGSGLEQSSQLTGLAELVPCCHQGDSTGFLLENSPYRFNLAPGL